MADSFVELNSTSGGADIDTETVVNANGKSVQRQRMQIGGANGTDVAYVIDNSLSVQIDDFATSLLWAIEQLTNPMSQDPSTGRVRVSLESAAATVATTISSGTVNTVSTVSNITQLAGFDIKQTQLYDASLQTWNSGFRPRII